MNLDAISAKALAAIILISTQGEARLKPQLPLNVVDRGDSWLVKGTPFTDTKAQSRYCMFYVFLKKTSSQVLTINFAARMMVSKEDEVHWRKSMSPQDFDRIFGPQTVFEADGHYLDLYGALYGGVVNNPGDAAAYAHVLMRSKPGLALIPETALQAEERDKVWHISAKVPGHDKPSEILSFSRYDGRLMSGDL